MTANLADRFALSLKKCHSPDFRLQIVLFILVVFTSACVDTRGTLEKELDDILVLLDGGITIENLRQVDHELSVLRERIVEDERYYNKVIGELYGPRRSLGQYNGKELLLAYHCEDVCPVYGGFAIFYKDVDSPEHCAAVGGRAIYSHAWGVQYRSCSPL